MRNSAIILCKTTLHTLSTVMLKEPTVSAGGSGGTSIRPPSRLRLAEPRLVGPWYSGPFTGSSLAGSFSFQLNTTRAVLACNVKLMWYAKTKDAVHKTGKLQERCSITIKPILCTYIPAILVIIVTYNSKIAHTNPTNTHCSWSD